MLGVTKLDNLFDDPILTLRLAGKGTNNLQSREKFSIEILVKIFQKA
jgi:hypothetical protein